MSPLREGLALLHAAPQGLCLPGLLLPGALARAAAVAFGPTTSGRSFSSTAAPAAQPTSSGGEARGAPAAGGASPAHQRRKQRRQAAPAPPPWGHVPDEQLPLRFSLRPSVLSPLHPLHREQQRLHQRSEFLGLCIEAQTKLSSELDARNEEQVTSALADRRAKLAALTNAYAAAARAAPLPPPASPGQGQGYMMVLEQQLADKHADALEFQRVLNGERDVWDYWFNDFAPRYEGLPGLGPLDAAINAPTTLEEAQKLRRRALRSLLPDGAPAARAPRVDEHGRARATGRRKTATAAVFIWAGSGRVTVNRSPLDLYFSDVNQRAALLKPLMVVGATARFDVAVQVSGSGYSGQAQAAAHGIARALQNFDPAAYRATLRRAGLLKRDPRMVERKKPGRAKARKAFTWVKR
ncbi:30S ribosomal protein S9 [Raphidocelis subcapitata]|uniref:Small ribosomal subunit protein uS9c n=1 Tax=Raphidocelis subcapitata TaxID=307507 RepID=A0A2V0NRU0_9CHLO|nr:30S ribosomal protein S9 [Raphidocelis subcapitata]|eukprot:GBF87647.1 30S ribosomal protein S9 [Raphidocelis subcapitata]